MHRDWDTVREILLDVESLDPASTLTLKNFDSERAYEISYHVEILEEAGLIHANMSKALGPQPTQFHVYRLTWEGHEFLDAVRDESVWKETSSKVADFGGGLSFEVIKAIAVEMIKETLGLP